MRVTPLVQASNLILKKNHLDRKYDPTRLLKFFDANCGNNTSDFKNKINISICYQVSIKSNIYFKISHARPSVDERQSLERGQRYCEDQTFGDHNASWDPKAGTGRVSTLRIHPPADILAPTDPAGYCQSGVRSKGSKRCSGFLLLHEQTTQTAWLPWRLQNLLEFLCEQLE